MSDVFLFTLSLGVTVLGLMASWAAFRRRGLASGMRGAAWSLIPLAAYLTGVEKFLRDLVFSPVKWAGVTLVGVGAVLYVVSGVMLRSGGPDDEAPAEVKGKTKKTRAVEQKKAPKGAEVDPDMAEIERILKGRGIN